MRGGVLPPALLFAALAFALAFAPRRVMLTALALVPLPAVLIASVDFPKAWVEAIFVGCWLSVFATAALVHLLRPLGLAAAMALALNAAIWAGATIAVAGTAADLLKALPVLLIAVPAQWGVAKGAGIAVKVIASWLVAVAVLAGALAAVPTPGYVSDHME